MASIVTLCDKGFAGVNRACRELARATGLTRHLVLTHADPHGPESTFLLEHLREKAPDLLLFCGGWSHLYERFLAELADGSTQLGFWWLSSGGQMGLAGELDRLTRLLSDPRLAQRYFSSRPLYQALAVRSAGVHYLPPIFTIPPWKTRPSQSSANISLFCGPDERGRKNVVNCLLALASVKRPFQLHLNGLSQDNAYRSLLGLLALPFVDHGWLPEEQLDSVLRSMDLGLLISLAETFGYPVVDHLLRGVPILGTPMVPSLQLLPPSLRKELEVISADDAQAIASQIDFFLSHPQAGYDLSLQARPHLLAANRRAIAAARRALS